jgi:hypothetical protein
MEGDLCVLQVLEQADHDPYYSGRSMANWRDAKATDLLQVAAYTRAHDAIDRALDSLVSTVSHLQDQVGRVLEQNERLTGQAARP